MRLTMYKREFSFKAFCIALLALLFSLLNVFGNVDMICPVDSCQIFDDFYIFGISLWLYSSVFFTLIIILLLFKYFSFAYLLLSLALFSDFILLIYMMLIAPCFQCLIIAFFIAWLYKTLRTLEKIRFFPLLLSLWAVFFIVNVGALIKSNVEPFAIYTSKEREKAPLEASMRIYFSPSCSSCNELVELLGNAELTKNGDIAWFAVAENQEDIALIAHMEKSIKKGNNLQEALELAKTTRHEVHFSDTFTHAFTQFKILVNQSRLQSAGTSRIPFVEYTGIPSHLKAGQELPKSALDNLRTLSPDYQSTNPSSVDSLLNLGVAGYCDEESELPCE